LKKQRLGHAVVIDGRNAFREIMIRDLAQGTEYEMTDRDFLSAWTGAALYRRV
jgi:hypothetical protein